MENKHAGNELLQFLGGLIMLILGLYIFMQRVSVSTNFFSGSILSIGGIQVTSGMVVIPFIIGVVIAFVKPESLLGKIIMVCGILIIIASIIMSTKMQLQQMSLYEWLLILFLIFGGGGMVARVLFASPSKKQQYQDTDYKKYLK
ncbi:hypothetical protein lbkm_2035 [Lachnospiraceae bacterium KM106-2]|nr:hypothetical protein lbkm_2035 [Lachnospiraceae bacterium KM106-2]